MKKVYSLPRRLLFVSLPAISMLSVIGCSKNGYINDKVIQASAVDKGPGLSPNCNRGHKDTTFIVDQSYVNLVSRFSYNVYLGPLGQEFTPSLHAVNAVELQFDDASCSLSGGPGGDLAVRIRESSITGKILGTSASQHFPNCFLGVMRFHFPSSIQLRHGQKYVIEPFYISGNTFTVYLDIMPLTPYPGGDFILGGVVQPGKDMWFREGLERIGKGRL